jgi:hypothetical protein
MFSLKVSIVFTLILQMGNMFLIIAKCLLLLLYWLVEGSFDFGVCDLAFNHSFSHHSTLSNGFTALDFM